MQTLYELGSTMRISTSDSRVRPPASCLAAAAVAEPRWLARARSRALRLAVAIDVLLQNVHPLPLPSTCFTCQAHLHLCALCHRRNHPVVE